MAEVFLGYDPGGVGANGVALLRVPGAGPHLALAATVDSVDDAVTWFQNNAGHDVPFAAGIDTYLSWATSQSGWRPMDLHLRETYPAVQKSVFASNSAAGSMAVQGMAMALRLKSVWPNIGLNETHPKVQYYALTQQHYVFAQPMITWLVNSMGAQNPPAMANDHEWDAMFSAWACRQMHQHLWIQDLMTNVQGLLLPAGGVTYFWP